MTVPAYLPYYVLGFTLIVVVTMILGIHRATERAGWPREDRARVLRGAGIVLLGWFAATVALSLSDAYRSPPDELPTIQYAIAIPILIGAFLIWRSATVRRLIEAVPQSWLVGIQVYRALGIIFIILYLSAGLPGLFAWPAGVGDVAIGLAAPIVAARYARDPARNAGLVRAWNGLGIADLVVAVAMGFLTSPSPFQLFTSDTPNELIITFPLVLVPVFLVPLSILLHLASLARLRRTAAADDRPMATLVT